MVKITQILSLNKSKAKEVPVLANKNFYSFKSLFDAEGLHFIYLNLKLQILLEIAMERKSKHKNFKKNK